MKKLNWFHKILMALILLVTLISSVNGVDTSNPNTNIFTETWSSGSPYNTYTKLNCTQGTYLTSSLIAGQILDFDHDWYCGYSNIPSDVIFSETVADLISTESSLKLWVINGDSSTQYSTIMANPVSNITLDAEDTIQFGCNLDLNVSSNNTGYFIMSPYSTIPSSKVTAISLKDGGCDDWFGTSYDPDILTGSSNCCEVSDITGYDCTAGNTLQTFTVQDMVSSCSGISLSELDEIGRFDFWTNTRVDGDTYVWVTDDLKIFTPPTYNITNQSFYEDFEDHNKVYPTSFLTNDCAVNPSGFTGSSENPTEYVCYNTKGTITSMDYGKSALLSGQSHKTAIVSLTGNSAVYELFFVNLTTPIVVDSNFLFGLDFNYMANCSTTGEIPQIRFFNTTGDQIKNIDLASPFVNVAFGEVTSDVGGADNYRMYNSTDFTDILGEAIARFEIYATYTGSGSCGGNDGVRVALDNIYMFGGGTPINVTPPVIPNITTEIYFEELFGTAGFSYDEDECSTNGDTTTQMLIYSSAMPFGNYSWRCYMDSKSFNYISFDNTSDTTKINTPQGLELYSSTTLNFGNRQRKLTTIFTGGDNVDLDYNDTISFSCMIPDQSTGIDAYLYFGRDDNTTGLISLGKENATATRCDVSGIPDAHCCDLSDIVGESLDCQSNTKVNVELGVQEIINACPEFVDYDFVDMTDIGLWITDYDFFGSSNIYFDDYRFSARTGLVGNNTLPIVASVSPDPDPANISETVTWSMYVWDDDSQEDIYTAFDCENDGSLDYGWQLNRTTVASKVWEFNCTYSSEGTYTAKAWASDIAHYPINISGTGQVEVALTSTEEEGGNCIGFTAPSCTGDCEFYDDFSYTGYPVTCNGWYGVQKHPVNQKFVLQNLNFSEYSTGVEYDDIYGYDYNTVLFTFDWIINTDNRVIMTLGQSVGGLNAVYLYWDGGSLFALDSVTPFVTNLGAYIKGTEYSLTAIVDFANDEISYTVFGNNATVQFFDQDTPSIGDIDLSWDSVINTNVTFDNFLVSTGEVNANGTAPVQASTYTYDGDLFCGINWTQDPPRFSQQNCEDRGYPITGSLVGLCLPRACLSDVGSSLFQSAMNNILLTLVVLIAILLVFPLLIAMRKKR